MDAVRKIPMPAEAPDPATGAFNRGIDALGLVPLWTQLHTLVPATPAAAIEPVLWRYAQVREALMRAGELVTAAEAVRRVLVMENPALRGRAAVTQTLYAGLQLILPGELAPSHRHTQSALRLVVEGSSAHTAVDGERIPMQPGDFIITPSWTWHDHGNPSAEEGGEPVVWLDGLDIPLIQQLGAQFAQTHPALEQPLRQVQGSSLARYGSGLLPLQRPAGQRVPLCHYPYARTREALERLSRNQDIDPWEGVKLRYANPVDGGWAMPSIATCVQWLPKGFVGLPVRRTDATVYSVIEGKGVACIGQKRFHFGAKDLFVVPSWARLSLQASQESVLFSFSDRPLHEALGVLRELREDA